MPSARDPHPDGHRPQPQQQRASLVRRVAGRTARLTGLAIRYAIVRPGRGPDASLAPNNWTSVFHGPAWSPLLHADGTPTGSWYLHLFDSTQPDFDWTHPEVLADFDATLRFWFDLGIDGFRIDVAHGLAKQEGLPDQATQASEDGLLAEQRTPYWDQDGVHDIYRRWRAIADAYDPPRVFCG
jgi:alpha-glucosidase